MPKTKRSTGHARRGRPVGVPAAQRALAAMAADVLAVAVGDRLATVQEMQARFGVGSGTVRKALQELEAAGALAVRAHGHQGTVVTSRDVGLLWELSDRTPLRVATTPPGALDQVGFIQGIHEQCDDLGLPFVSRYVRGARRRIGQLLRAEVDLVILSQQAAAELSVAERRRVTVAAANDVRYYSNELLVCVSRGASMAAREGNRLRVGIDRDSRDHVALTELAFKAMEVDYVDCVFNMIPRSILSDEIDAGVWHRVLTLIPPELAGLQVVPLEQAIGGPIRDDLLGLAFAHRRDDSGVSEVLGEMDMKTVSRRQREIMASFSDDEELFAQAWLQ